MTEVPPAQRLLFENEEVRVWEMTLEPGEAYPLHAHTHAYFSIVTSAARLILTDEDGNERAMETTPDTVVWQETPDTHAVRNVGETRFESRLVELKRR
jgi:hypothetical protein